MNITGNEMEVLADFKKALGKIDFNGYNPESDEFRCAMFIGLMWLLLKHLSDEEGGHQWGEDIMEELEGARKYLDCLETSGDEMYMEMAGDELRHAELLIKHRMESHPEKSLWLDAVRSEHDKMKEALESWGMEAHGEAHPQFQPAAAMPARIGNASRA